MNTLQPIPVTSEGALKRMADIAKQLEQLQLIQGVTLRTLADVYEVPEGWQFDPASGAFMPPAESLELSSSEEAA
jgi:hypothetical protein